MYQKCVLALRPTASASAGEIKANFHRDAASCVERNEMTSSPLFSSSPPPPLFLSGGLPIGRFAPNFSPLLAPLKKPLFPRAELNQPRMGCAFPVHQISPCPQSKLGIKDVIILPKGMIRSKLYLESAKLQIFDTKLPHKMVQSDQIDTQWTT